MRISDWSSDVCSSDLLLAPLDEEREGRAGAGAMAVENILLTRIGDEPQIAESLDLGMVAQICADLQRIFARSAHAQFERFEAAQQHPGGVGIADGADRVAHRADVVEQLLVARHAARAEVRLAARDRKSTRLHSSH